MATLRRRRWRILAVAGGVLLTALALPLGHAWQRQLVLRHWQQALARADADQARGILAQARELGGDSPALFAAALAASDERVVATARQLLLESLDDWELLAPAAAHQRLDRLLTELEAVQARATPAGRGAAADVALRVLLWPRRTAEPPTEQLRRIAQCERLLKSVSVAQAAEPAARPAPSEPADRSHGAVSASISEAAADRAPPALLEPETSMAALPPLAMPRSLLETPRLAPLQPDDPAAFDRGALPATATPRPANAAAPPVALVGSPGGLDTMSPVPLAPDPGTPPAAGPHSGGPAPSTSPSQVVAEGTPTDLSRQGVPALLLRLHQPADAAAAHDELLRRGLGVVEIEIGRGLASPDVQQRRATVAALPRMAGIDAKAWLLLASRDSDAEVRYTAVTLLATSGDHQLVETARSIAAADGDPRMQRLAAQLANRPR